MTTYSDSTTFYGYAGASGRLLTSLFGSQGAATSAFYSRFEREVNGVEWDNYRFHPDGKARSYNENHKAYRQALRDAAKKLSEGQGTLVTYRLVRNDG